ncbi:MAG: DNA primase [Melioribacteraceae bacterium]|nr:DNA primase [Melioribacteraceae bacterium]MCF8262941.1 DNA primase [Melioribacteraceae bacterium]MCF8430626.1 DNA primase [Melioribacteraceae bacterium]
MRIPEQKIDEIRNSSNIVDIVSGYVQLKKRGKNFIGLCPFHQEKTPSFTVSQEKQIYHCFGCHSGGNIYKFLMEYNNISFIEAVQEVAGHVGIKLDLKDGFDNEQQNEQELYYEINRVAALYFSNNLLKSSQGEIPREYLKNRNIKTQTQRIFGIGWALNEWENLLNYLRESKIDLEKAAHLGLIDKRNDSSFYDKFRGRIIFPIFSPNGRVIAFGGRVLEKDAKTAKYLNSPESTIYLKRKSLYGLYHSKDEIRKLDKAILVEGYMDLVMLHQFGIKNVVASSGTSLTEEQVQLLSRFTRNVVVLFDSDKAGEAASLRSIETLLKYDFDVKLASLPEGDDPDSYLNKNGKDEFVNQLKKAENFIEYQTRKFQKAGMFDDPTKYSDAVKELVKSVSFVNDELKRSILLKNISQKFNLREKLLESELDKLMSENERRAENRRMPENAPPSSAAPPDVIEQDKRFMGLEKQLIKILFEGDENIMGTILDEIPPDDYSNKSFRYLAKLVFENFKKNIHEPAALIEKIEHEELKSYILKLSLEETPISKKWEEKTGYLDESDIPTRFAKDLIINYKIIKIENEISALNNKITSSKIESEVRELLEEVLHLTKEKNELVSSKKEVVNDE